MYRSYRLKCLLAGMALIASVRGYSQELKSMEPHSGRLHARYQDTLHSPGAGWTERIGERKSNHSMWEHTSGKLRMEYSAEPVNYRDQSGDWQRIDPSLRPISGGWLAAQQPHPVHIGYDGTVSLSHGLTTRLTTGLNLQINGQPVNPENPEPFSAGLVQWSIGEGIQRIVEVGINQAKSSIRFLSPPALAGPALTISEEIEIPAGATIRTDEGEAHSDGWAGDLVIVRGKELVGRIRGAWCRDDTGNYHPAVYTWESVSANRWRVTASVPASWSHDPLRAYPLLFDPLVIGPTSNYTGGILPSCFLPATSSDSILVVIPGGITVTACYVTGSYFADPVFGAVMANGALRFSTTCGQTALLSVQGPTGSIAGTGYVDGSDFRPQLMCCFTPSCSPTSFYLSMHIGRNTPAGGCTSTHISYQPSSPWPFRAYVEGYTVEATGSMWTVPSQPICSDACEVSGTARIRYGVRPYTFSHPWMNGTVVEGTPQPCDFSITTEVLPLVRPNCPDYCPEYSSLPVPPPLVTDACGNIALNMPVATLNILPAPEMSLPEPQQVCSGEPFELPLNVCPPDATITWNGADLEGTGPITGVIENEGGENLALTFQAIAQAGNCMSDVVTIPLTVLRSPQASFTITPAIPLFGQVVTFQSTSIAGAGTVTDYEWTIGESVFLTGNPVNYLFPELGEHDVCLEITTSEGCEDVTCRNIEVVPAELVIPNIFTPNGDGLNDTLHFQYLESFPENELTVYNRWGAIVLSRKGYRNDWNGGDLSEGTYYFILTRADWPTHSGYVQLVR